MTVRSAPEVVFEALAEAGVVEAGAEVDAAREVEDEELVVEVEDDDDDDEVEVEEAEDEADELDVCAVVADVEEFEATWSPSYLLKLVGGPF